MAAFCLIHTASQNQDIFPHTVLVERGLFGCCILFFFSVILFNNDQEHTIN